MHPDEGKLAGRYALCRSSDFLGQFLPPKRRHRKKPFGTCKLCFDTTLVAIACVLSFVFFGRINGLGAGTIASALIVGPIVNVVNARFPLIGAIRSLSGQAAGVQAVRTDSDRAE